MNPKKRTAVALILLVAAVLFTAACRKKVTAPPPPPPPPPAAPTVTLSAAPSTIDQGQSARLTWSSENATKLDLQPGVGSVNARGDHQVSPRASTTYTLTVTGPGGSDSATARVTVVVPPPPPPPPPPPKEISEVELFGQNIKHAYFDYDRYDIRLDAGEALSQNADFLRSRPGLRFTVEGHCDERGSEEYNLGLGDRRANSAKEYLVNLGISEDRVRTVSYGKARPSCTESNDECWQKNRRAHMRYGLGIYSQ